MIQQWVLSLNTEVEKKVTYLTERVSASLKVLGIRALYVVFSFSFNFQLARGAVEDRSCLLWHLLSCLSLVVSFVSQPKEQRRTPLKIAVSSPIQYMSIIYCFILSKHFPWNNIDISCSESCCGCWVSVVFLLSSRIADWKFSLCIFKCSISVVCDFFCLLNSGKEKAPRGW